MKSQRGFSMIELMIAITLALVVSEALIQVFIGSRRTYQATAGVSNVTDGGRFALNFIGQSARNAGWFACAHGSSQTVTSNLVTGAVPPMAYDFTRRIGGFEANGTGPATALAMAAAPVAADGNIADWTANLDAALGGLVVKGNDVLVLRSSISGIKPVYVSVIAPGAVSFNVNNTAGLQNNQLAAISDCTKSVIFQITGLAAGAGGLVTHAAGGGPPGNLSGPLNPDFSLGAVVSPVTTTVYYIGVGADGDGALWSMDLNGTSAFTATELVPDVENMQILYGVDTTGAGVPTQYVTANNVANFDTVVAIKVALLAASVPAATQPPTVAPTFNLLGTTVTAPIDGRVRQVFTATITLRNAAT